jgi:hypothetical protein
MNRYFVVSKDRYFGPFDSYERALRWVRSQECGAYEIRNVLVWGSPTSQQHPPVSLENLCRGSRKLA